MKTVKQNNQILYVEKQSINSKLPTTVSKPALDSLPTVNKSHISELVVTVPIRSNPLHYDIVPLSESLDTAYYFTVPKIAFTI